MCSHHYAGEQARRYRDRRTSPLNHRGRGDRRQRLGRLGLPPNVAYADLEAVTAEVEAARRFCRQHGLAVVDVTDRPVETCAGEVTALVGGSKR